MHTHHRLWEAYEEGGRLITLPRRYQLLWEVTKGKGTFKGGLGAYFTRAYEVAGGMQPRVSSGASGSLRL